MADAQFKRRMIEVIKHWIETAHSQGKFIKEDKLIAHFGIKEGIARRKMLEYLKDLEDTEYIIREFGEIVLKEAPKPIEEIVDKEIKEVLGEDANL